MTLYYIYIPKFSDDKQMHIETLYYSYVKQANWRWFIKLLCLMKIPIQSKNSFIKNSGRATLVPSDYD